MNQNTTPNGKPKPFTPLLFRKLVLASLVSLAFVGGILLTKTLIESEGRGRSMMSTTEMLARSQDLLAIIDGSKPTPRFVPESGRNLKDRTPGPYDQIFTEFLVEFSEGVSGLPQRNSFKFWFLLSDRPHGHGGPCIAVKVIRGDDEAMFHLDNTLGDDARGLASHALEHASESARDLLELETDAGVPQSQKL